MHKAASLNPMLPVLPPAVFSLPGTADYFACSVSHVRDLIREKQLPVVRMGRRVVVRRVDADLFLQRQAEASVAGSGTPVAPCSVAEAMA